MKKEKKNKLSLTEFIRQNLARYKSRPEELVALAIKEGITRNPSVVRRTITRMLNGKPRLSREEKALRVLEFFAGEDMRGRQLL